MTNDNVQGFNAVDKIVKYFPKGIEKFFENILLLRIINCGLLEIHQFDLMPFSKLAFINFGKNEIKILEKGLFEFNLNLKAVGFESNQIVHIDPNIFDNLDKLENFWFEDNVCINVAADDRNGVIEAVNIAKSQCVQEVSNEIADSNSSAVKQFCNKYLSTFVGMFVCVLTFCPSHVSFLVW